MTTQRTKREISKNKHANDNAIGVIYNAKYHRLRDMPCIYMSLEGVPRSSEASELVELLCDNLFPKASSRGRSGLVSAVGAVLNDCLRASATGAGTLLRRGMSVASFKGCRVNYRAATKVLHAMVGAGLLEKAGGNYERSGEGGQGTVSRFWPTSGLIEEMSRHGLHPDNMDAHFRHVPNRPTSLPPILLNTAKKRQGNRMPSGGKAMLVDDTDPTVVTFAAQVKRINDFTSKASFGGMHFVGFQRLFNCGDDSEFNWDMGGRLWERGGYQQWPKDRLRKRKKPYFGPVRSEITINGSPTVEVDIGSSHLTIFLHQQGIDLDPHSDLYEIPGFNRDIIKQCVNYFLSEPKQRVKWSPSTVTKFLEKKGYPINRDHSFADVREACLERYPILRDRESIDVTWATLQFQEAQAVINAVDRLNQEYGIVALPVHDSLIVREEDREVSVMVLKEEFEKVVGVIPRVE